MATHQKTGNKDVVVKVSDLAYLLYNFILAQNVKEIGDMHAVKTMQEQLMDIDKHVHVPLYGLENALYYCNMLNELGKFYHPTLVFPMFLFGIEKRAGIKFDKNLNIAERNK